MLELATKPVSKLATISRLFEALHAHSIRYCHWKSNEHLAASMQGLTDLDVLFAADQKQKIEIILQELEFKRFNAISQKLYKDIVDFLIIDPPSGKLIHLHAHFRLTMGQPYLKGYQLSSSIERGILATREFDETYGLFCSKPAFELVLLFIRESLRLRHRDMIWEAFENKRRYKESILREYHWLRERTTDKEIRRVVKQFFNDNTELYNLVAGDFTRDRLKNLSRIVKNGDFFTALYSPFDALIRRWYREATVIFSRKFSTLLNRPILFKRINPRGGRVIAVIGADGSGKSTVTRMLKSTFDAKLDLYNIYFGRGDGKASHTRKVLHGSRALLNRSNGKGSMSEDSATAPQAKTGIKNLYRCLNAILVAREKRRNLRLMQMAKIKGALIICDRYPQNQIMGYNDGPLLNDLINSPNPILRAFARIEQKVYAQAESYRPDLVFKLVADAEEVEKRKPGETSPERLRKKIQGIVDLKFHPATEVITVDASKPLDEVLTMVRTEIWKRL